MPAQRGALAAGRAASHRGRRVAARGGEVVPLPGPQELSVARQIRARELAAGASPEAIAAAIMDGCGPAYGTTWIRARRLALGIALADVVAQVRARYLADGRSLPRFSETLLSAYESGQKRPGPEYLHYLCATYLADPGDLGYEGRCLCGRGHRGSPDAAAPGAARVPEPAAVSRQAAGASRRGRTGAAAASRAPGAASAAASARPADEADDEVLRSTLLRLMADAGTGPDEAFLGAADRIRRRMDEALLAGRVSASMVDQWERATAGYGRRYMTAPPLRLLCDALLDFGDVRRMCRERQPLDLAERLCRLAGRLAGLAGIALIDLGDQRLARSFFRTAETAADETGDRALRAWVAVRECLVPYYYGDPREAAALARTAADLAGRSRCAPAVMAPVMQARALARLAGKGKRDARDRAMALLDRAHDALGDLPEEDRQDTVFGYTERQLMFHEGDTLVALGDWRRAERALTAAQRLYPPAEFLDSALVTLGRARCLLEAGEPEQALTLSRDTVARLPREHRPEIVVRMARALGSSAAARHAGLRAAHEHAEALLTG
jgi:tetratricopeptide (TPR) repeat protein